MPPLLLWIYAGLPGLAATLLASYVVTSRLMLGYWPITQVDGRALELGLYVFHDVVGGALVLGIVSFVAYPVALIVWEHATPRLRMRTQLLFVAGHVPFAWLLWTFHRWYGH